MADVLLRKVVKRYDEVEAVRGIDLDIADHEFVVLVGPSGCGKSTTLRMIAGLEDITDGDIMIGGDVVNDVPPKDRDIAMVFQNYALYPHMTVYANMAFALKRRNVSREATDQRVRSAASMLGVQDLLERTPEVAASRGSACHAGSVTLSPVLKAMGVPPREGRGAVRFSVGRYTTEEEIDRAAAALRRTASKG